MGDRHRRRLVWAKRALSGLLALSGAVKMGKVVIGAAHPLFGPGKCLPRWFLGVASLHEVRPCRIPWIKESPGTWAALNAQCPDRRLISPAP